MAIRIAPTETKAKPQATVKPPVKPIEEAIEAVSIAPEGKPAGKRGFGSMDVEKRRLAQSKGGASVAKEKRHFAANPEKAREAGRKGGMAKSGKAKP